MSREVEILSYINSRKKANEKPMPCIFDITVSNISEEEGLYSNESISILTDIFDKYGIEYQQVDTVEGSFNLNRDWIETKDIPCYIEYCGVYPINWDIKDVVTLEQLEYTGKVIIKVTWHPEEDKYIPNH